MPDKTGWEALRELKADPDLQDVPVVIISVVAGEQERGNLFGSVDLLTKPVDRAELHAVIKRNLAETRGRRVLVVDDDPGTREFLKSNLEKAGAQVTIAGDGTEAEAALEGVEPDLILLDLMMPGMDGTTFLQRLRTHHARSDVPVI